MPTALKDKAKTSQGNAHVAFQPEELRKRTLRPQHVRNLAYLASTENRHFSHKEAGYVRCATWSFHVACLLFVFLCRRLAMPRLRHGS